MDSLGKWPAADPGPLGPGGCDCQQQEDEQVLTQFHLWPLSHVSGMEVGVALNALGWFWPVRSSMVEFQPEAQGEFGILVLY